MEKRDYLLRQIEALGRILSRLRSLIVGGDTASAAAEIREEMRNAGLDLAMANALSSASVCARAQAMVCALSFALAYSR